MQILLPYIKLKHYIRLGGTYNSSKCGTMSNDLLGKYVILLSPRSLKKGTEKRNEL